jgi:hypothetical protein
MGTKIADIPFMTATKITRIDYRLYFLSIPITIEKETRIPTDPQNENQAANFKSNVP